MAFIDWSDAKLSVGVGELDDQHKKLVALVNELHEAMRAGKSREVMHHMVTQLKKYVRDHFTAEEKYMQTFAYPDMAVHTAEHNQFVEKVLDFELELSEGRAIMSIQVMTFLRDWLATHIQGTDKKYTEFFNAKGLK